MAGWDDLFALSGVNPNSPPAQDPMALLQQQPAAAQPFDIGAALGYPTPAAPAAPPPPDDRPPAGMLPMMDTAPARPTKQPAEPAYVRETREASEMQAAAIQKQAAAEAAKNAETSERQSVIALGSLNRQRELEEDRVRLNADVDKRQTGILQRVQALGQKKIDPGQVGKDLGPGGTFALAALGFLAGFTRSDKGGAAPIVAMLDKMIERSVTTQAANLERADKALAIEQQALGQEFTRGAANSDARLTAELRLYDQATKVVQAEAARWDSPIAAAKAQQLLAGVMERRTDRIQNWQDQQRQLANQEKQTAISGGHLALARAGFEEGKKQWALERQDKLAAAKAAGDEAAIKRIKDEGDREVPLLDPETQRPWVARDQKTADEAKEILAKAENAERQLTERSELVQQWQKLAQNPVGNTEKMTRLEKLIDQKDGVILTTIQSQYKLGSLDDGAVALAKKMTGSGLNLDPNQMVPPDELRREMRAQNSVALKRLGFKGANTRDASNAIEGTGYRPAGFQPQGTVPLKAVPPGETARAGRGGRKAPTLEEFKERQDRELKSFQAMLKGEDEED